MDWFVAFFKSVVLVYFMAMAWLIALSLMKIANFIDRFSLRTVVMKRQNCLLALKEPTCGILDTKAEIPDILAWSTGWMFNAKVLTTMIEVKVSYSDYLANSSKKGDLGNFRYWLFTDELFNEIEEKDRRIYQKPWGILVRKGRTMTMVKSSEPFLSKDVETENLILLHALRQCGDFCRSMEVEDDGMDEIFNITACRHRLTDPQCSK